MRAGRETESRAAGIGRPLIGSAAGHLAFLACFLLWGAAAGPGLPGVVQVVLIEGTTDDVSSGEKTFAAAAAGVPRRPGIRPETERTLSPASPMSLPPPFPPATEDLPTAPAAAVYRDPSPAGPAPQSTGLALRTGGEAPVPAPVGTPGRTREALPRDAKLPGGGREGAEILLLRERIESRIDYPEEAIRRGQEGEVLLRIRVGEGGIPKEIRVARSSGARVLDEAARNGVVRAAPLPSTPGWFEVPVRFRLR